MLITSKGQVTIPKDLRETLGLLPHTHVKFERMGNELRVKKSETPSHRGAKLVEHMTGKGSIQMSTDEIMQLTRGD